MAKSIGQLCDKSQRLANESMRIHGDIVEYCNSFAQKHLNNQEFNFDALPDPIVEVVFYGGAKPNEGWVKFLKAEVIAELKRNGIESMKKEDDKQ